ncbi:hypothetical protein QBC39DRAFT_362034 [Podospora conica]|nr:hypothetical protein QBC39DRAFT_362034 [Schizothecium conicum]
MPAKRAPSLCVNMGSSDRADAIHDMDIKYRESLHKTEIQAKHEETRRMRLRSMVVSDEAASLKGVVSQRESRIKKLAEQASDARAQLDSLQEKCRRQEKMVQNQAREIANLKEEMSSLGSLSQDSAKLLSEKLALAREVAVLKPEMDHLRSQLEHQKDVLAEKLALERQVNTLEVELANEKRAASKAARKQDQESEEEAELRKQVQELEKQLAKERKAAQKNLQAQESRSSDAETELEALREELAAAQNNLAAEKRKTERLAKNQNSMSSAVEEELVQLRHSLADTKTALATEKRAAQRAAKASAAQDDVSELAEKLAAVEQELARERKEKARIQKEQEQFAADLEVRQEAINGKVDRLKARLRESQEELKQCREDLERAQERAVTIPKSTTTSVPLKRPAAVKPPVKKRAGKQLGVEESMLQTPDHDDRPKRPLKKKPFELASAVEKSTFSITPFLNKTMNLSETSKVGDDATRTAPILKLHGGETTTTVPVPEDSEPSMDSPEPEAAEPELPAEKKPRTKVLKRPLGDGAAKKNPAARGRKVSAQESSLEQVAEEPDEVSLGQENRSGESATAAVAEPEPKKKKRKILGASNKPSLLFEDDEGEKVAPAKRPPKSASLAGVRAKAPLGGIKNAFAGASFSPLKRDRRGVGASFLA